MTEYNEEQYLQDRLYMSNEAVGELGYYDCKICKNRGFINYIKSGDIVAKKCKCMAIRNVYCNLEKWGMSRENLEEFTFEKYKTDDIWQEVVKRKAKDFLEEKDNKWFVISGQHGCGKTHICTAVFKELLLRGNSGRYMLWKDNVTKLKSLKKSALYENQKSYDELITDFKKTDVLYIDDFMKLTDKYQQTADLEVAYEILNARYQNRLTTIISTEFYRKDIEGFDGAIAGRIFQRCDHKKYWIELKNEEGRNYRIKEESG